ncbi:MAG: lasso peptide biosynthesis B2 protein [Dehalococcoidia bacterium]
MSPRDWLGIGQAYIFLAWAGWQIFVRKKKLDYWIGGGPRVEPIISLAGDVLNRELRRAWWIEVAAARPLRWAMCLQRSLALCLWMQRKGYQPLIRIGIRRDNPQLDAHAWVECGGIVLNDDPNLSASYASLRSRGRP